MAHHTHHTSFEKFSIRCTIGDMGKQVSKRIPWIDEAKGVAMILVFYGHLPGSGDNPWFPHLMTSREIIYLFHMPLFFILSGLTFHKTSDFKKFVCHRFKRLIIPYYFFSLYALAKIILKALAPTIFSSFHSAPMSSTGIELINIVTGNAVGLWFFWGLFWGDIVLWFLGKLPIVYRNSLCILFLLAWPSVSYLHIQLPFQLLIAVEATAFTGLGWMLSDILKKTTTKQSTVFLLLFILLFSISTYFKLHISLELIEYCLTITCAVSGSLMIIFAAKCIVNPSHILEFIGYNTIIFYGFNGLSLALVKGIFFKIIPTKIISDSVASQFTAGIIILITACFICYLLTPIMHKYFWWALGEPDRKVKYNKITT